MLESLYCQTEQLQEADDESGTCNWELRATLPVLNRMFQIKVVLSV